MLLRWAPNTIGTYTQRNGSIHGSVVRIPQRLHRVVSVTKIPPNCVTSRQRALRDNAARRTQKEYGPCTYPSHHSHAATTAFACSRLSSRRRETPPPSRPHNRGTRSQSATPHPRSPRSPSSCTSARRAASQPPGTPGRRRRWPSRESTGRCRTASAAPPGRPRPRPA